MFLYFSLSILYTVVNIVFLLIKVCSRSFSLYALSTDLNTLAVLEFLLGFSCLISIASKQNFADFLNFNYINSCLISLLVNILVQNPKSTPQMLAEPFDQLFTSSFAKVPCFFTISLVKKKGENEV